MLSGGGGGGGGGVRMLEEAGGGEGRRPPVRPYSSADTDSISGVRIALLYQCIRGVLNCSAQRRDRDKCQMSRTPTRERSFATGKTAFQTDGRFMLPRSFSPSPDTRGRRHCCCCWSHLPCTATVNALNANLDREVTQLADKRHIYRKLVPSR